MVSAQRQQLSPLRQKLQKSNESGIGILPMLHSRDAVPPMQLKKQRSCYYLSRMQNSYKTDRAYERDLFFNADLHIHRKSLIC